MKKLVCICNQVTQSEIKKAVSKFGITTAQEVGYATKAGTTCGRCIPSIKKLLSESIQNVQLRINWPKQLHI